MKNKINLSIPKPCHENWEAMTSMEKGRFCGSCQKNVFDFTAATDRQILEAYSKNENLCGRFIASQLNRDLIAPKEKSSIWLATTSAIVSLLSLGNQEVFAQGEVKTEQTNKKVVFNNSDTLTTNSEREITGIVSDVTGPLPGVNVVIKGTMRGTQTDIEGKFSINAIDGEILVFSFLGMENQEISISDSEKYEIKMTDAENLSDMLISVGAISIKRTFFGRIFHKIRNQFR